MPRPSQPERATRSFQRRRVSSKEPRHEYRKMSRPLLVTYAALMIFQGWVERCFRELAVCHVSRNPYTNRPCYAPLLLPSPRTGCSCSIKVDYERPCHSPLSYSYIYIYTYIEPYRSVLIFVLYLVGIFRCKAHCLNRNSNRLSRLIQFHLNSPFNSRSHPERLEIGSAFLPFNSRL